MQNSKYSLLYRCLQKNAKWYTQCKNALTMDIVISIGLCNCEIGWTSQGDYFPKKGVACSINISAIRVLWVISFILSVFLLWRCSLLFMTKPMNIKYFKDNYKEPSYIFVFLLSTAIISHMVLCCLKISNPESRAIGIDFTTTFFYLIYYYFICVSCFVYQIMLVNFLLGYAKMMSNEAKETVTEKGMKIQFTIKSFIFFIFFIHCISFGLIYYPDHAYEIQTSKYLFFHYFHSISINFLFKIDNWAIALYIYQFHIDTLYIFNVLLRLIQLTRWFCEIIEFTAKINWKMNKNRLIWIYFKNLIW